MGRSNAEFAAGKGDEWVKVYRGVPSPVAEDEGTTGIHWTTSKHVGTRFAQYGDYSAPMSSSQQWHGENAVHEDAFEDEGIKHSGHRLEGFVHKSDIWDPKEPGALEYFREHGIYHPDDVKNNGQDASTTNKNEQEVTLKEGATVHITGVTRYDYSPDKPTQVAGYDQSRFVADRVRYPAGKGYQVKAKA